MGIDLHYLAMSWTHKCLSGCRRLLPWRQLAQTHLQVPPNMNLTAEFFYRGSSHQTNRKAIEHSMPVSDDRLMTQERMPTLVPICCSLAALCNVHISGPERGAVFLGASERHK